MEHVNKHNAMIDYIKFLSAVLVVFLHTIEQNPEIVEGLFFRKIFHIGLEIINPVEIFLLSTAFFYYRSSFNYNEKCFNSKHKEKLVHYIRLYLGWSVLYLPNMIIRARDLSEAGYGGLSLVLFWIKRIFVSGTIGIMWYMLGIIYSIYLIYFLLNYFGERVSLVFSVILYLISLLGSSYYNIINDMSCLKIIIDVFLNLIGSTYLLRVPIFMMIGYYLNKYDFRILNFRQRKFCLAIIVFGYCVFSYILSVERYLCAVYCTGNSYPTFISTPFAATLLFVLVINIFVESNMFSRFLSATSSIIYFIHWQIIVIFGKNWISMILSVFMSIFICIVYTKIKQNYYKKDSN